jgi:hypothetical protein
MVDPFARTRVFFAGVVVSEAGCVGAASGFGSLSSCWMSAAVTRWGFGAA